MFIMNHKIKYRSHITGFTLLEILIALFIFTIISMMLVSALHTVMNALSGTEENADRLRKMQTTLLIMSRDIEQIVNRPILDASGNEETALVGSPRAFTFTHMGYVTLAGSTANTIMQRTRYFVGQNALWRMTWPALDQAPASRPHARALLENVTDVRFQYLNQEGRFQDNWPPEGGGGSTQPLPLAIRIILSISNWGKISQLYVISAKASQNMQQPPTNPARHEREQES